MKRTLRITFLLIMLLVWVTGCQTGIPVSPEEPITATEIITSIPVQQEETVAKASSTPAAVTIEVEDPILPPGTIRQGAAFGYMDAYEVEEVATGLYDPAFPECGDAWLSDFAGDSGENVITLEYLTPVIPTKLELFTNLDPEKIMRVELLNSFSGLSIIFNETQPPVWEQQTNPGACKNSYTLEIDTDIEVDTIFIEFTDLSSAAQLDSAVLTGRLESYADPLVYWRIPIPNTPRDMVVNPLGEIFVATDMLGLYKYDLEGNQLDDYPAPNTADVMSVEADALGNFYLADAGYGWLVVFDAEGIQTNAGGDDIFGRLAYNHLDGSLYLLHGNLIEVYPANTLEFSHQVLLDATHSYGNLTFSPDGRLFLLRDFDWDAVLVEVDPSTGEEINAFPLVNSNKREIVAKDLTMDTAGNIYVLFGMNTGEIAVHMFDPYGNLIQRFGYLTSDANGWAEGSFLDPKAISVTQDGRFLVVADGYEDQSFLTTYLLEVD